MSKAESVRPSVELGIVSAASASVEMPGKGYRAFNFLSSNYRYFQRKEGFMILILNFESFSHVHELSAAKKKEEIMKES